MWIQVSRAFHSKQARLSHCIRQPGCRPTDEFNRLLPHQWQQLVKQGVMNKVYDRAALPPLSPENGTRLYLKGIQPFFMRRLKFDSSWGRFL